MHTVYTVYSRNVQRLSQPTENLPAQWECTSAARVVFTGYYQECIGRLAYALAWAEKQPGYNVHKNWRPGMFVLEPGASEQNILSPWVLYMEPGRPAKTEAPEPGTVSAGVG